MEYRLPYYMAYPMPLPYDDEREERRDYQYMQSLYPTLVKRILPYVENECARMSYAGSVIYDEYPDQLQIRMMCRRVSENVREQEELETTELEELIQMILYQELFRCRSEYRRKRRRFYL